MTVAQAVQRQLDKSGLTQQDAADRMGVSRQTLSQLVNGRRSITPDMALKLEAVFDVTAYDWLKLQAKNDLDYAKKFYRPQRRA